MDRALDKPARDRLCHGYGNLLDKWRQEAGGGTMKFEAVRNDIVYDEGMLLKPYHCSAGKLTIGVGRNLEDNGISTEEALMLLENDISRAANELDRNMFGWRGFSEARQRALLNMCFNLGWPRMSGFKNMIAAIWADDWDTAAAEALDSYWASQVGSRAKRIAVLLKEG